MLASTYPGLWLIKMVKGRCVCHACCNMHSHTQVSVIIQAHMHAHRGGVFFFQSGSCSPRAQLMRPPNSLDGSLGTLSIASNTSFRSAFGSVILPDFVGTPLMGASRLHAQAFVKDWC